MTEHGPMPSDGIATYVFAVCRSIAPAAVAALAGVIDEEPVRTMRFGTLTAVVQSVRAADFTDEVWQERLSDERELERFARAHHSVVSAVAACGPTVPLPLATLYHGEDRARRALTDETDRFRAALRRIAHHSEWGVKVYATAAPPDPPGGPPGRAGVSAARTSAAPGAGRAYLARKRGMQEQRERRQEDALRIAEAVDAEFRNLSTASRRLRPHGVGPAGERRTQVLNATYLVAEHRAGDLALLTRTLREGTGAQIELSGPWVPYSFVGEVQA